MEAPHMAAPHTHALRPHASFTWWPLSSRIWWPRARRPCSYGGPTHVVAPTRGSSSVCVRFYFLRLLNPFN